MEIQVFVCKNNGVPLFEKFERWVKKGKIERNEDRKRINGTAACLVLWRKKSVLLWGGWLVCNVGMLIGNLRAALGDCPSGQNKSRRNSVPNNNLGVSEVTQNFIRGD